MKWKIRMLVIVPVMGLLVSLVSPTAGALTLETIRGVVRDPLGTPVVGAAVSDGSQTVFTASDGSYVLEEDRIADYFVTAAKTGLDSESRIVTPIDAVAGPVDFVLMYRADLAAAPRTFNNSTAQTLAVEVKSYAPASSCVAWQDVASLAGFDLAFNSTAAGRSTWTGSFSVPTLLADGVYSHTAVVRHCASGTLLSRPATRTYLIDGAAPKIKFISPIDNSNTLVTALPVIFDVRDPEVGTEEIPGSGVDPTSIAVTVQDEAAAEAVQQLSTTLTGTIVKTPAATLQPNKWYVISVSVSDHAGNETTVSNRVWVMDTATVTPPGLIDIEVDPVSPSSVTPGGALEATDTYVWDGLQATVGSFEVTLDESAHPGDGEVAMTLDAAQAQVAYSVGGVPSPVPGTPVETSATLRPTYGADSIGLVEISAPSSTASVSRLTAKLPKGIDASSVRLSFAGQAATAALPICSDPTVGSCSPDPLPQLGPQIQVSFDANVAGGGWILSTVSVDDDPQPTVLASGTVPAAGTPLTLTVATSTLKRGNSDGLLFVRALKQTTEDTGYFASASVGLTEDEIADGALVDLGQPESSIVPVYDSSAEAEAQSPTCGSTCTGLGGDDPILTSPPVTATGEGGTSATEPTAGADEPLPTPSCAETDVCGTMAAPEGSAPTPKCDADLFGTIECVVNHEDSTQTAFRGYGQRSWGSWSQFRVEATAKQTWQIGARTKAGPFSADGSRTTEKGQSAADTFQVQGDCWMSGLNEPAGAFCSNDGRTAYYGQDPWRWELVETTYAGSSGLACLFVSCAVRHERLYARKYGGGATTGENQHPATWKRKPSEVKAGQWGNWAAYGPGTARERGVTKGTSYSLGASVSVNYPQSFGSATFGTTVKNENTISIINKINFRNNLPYIKEWWWYDNATDGRWEYYTCRNAVGYTTYGACWSSGA